MIEFLLGLDKRPKKVIFQVVGKIFTPTQNVASITEKYYIFSAKKNPWRLFMKNVFFNRRQNKNMAKITLDLFNVDSTLKKQSCDLDSKTP